MPLLAAASGGCSAHRLWAGSRPGGPNGPAATGAPPPSQYERVTGADCGARQAERAHAVRVCEHGGDGDRSAERTALQRGGREPELVEELAHIGGGPTEPPVTAGVGERLAPAVAAEVEAHHAQPVADGVDE